MIIITLNIIRIDNLVIIDHVISQMQDRIGILHPLIPLDLPGVWRVICLSLSCLKNPHESTLCNQRNMFK